VYFLWVSYVMLRSLAHIKKWVGFYLLKFKSSFHILVHSSLSDIYFANILSQSFHSLYIVLHRRENFNVHDVDLVNYFWHLWCWI
jgi:hypothetical protein